MRTRAARSRSPADARATSARADRRMRSRSAPERGRAWQAWRGSVRSRRTSVNATLRRRSLAMENANDAAEIAMRIFPHVVEHRAEVRRQLVETIVQRGIVQQAAGKTVF